MPPVVGGRQLKQVRWTLMASAQDPIAEGKVVYLNR